MQSNVRKIKAFFGIILGLFTLGVLILTVMGAQDGTNWYVTTDGNDDNSCLTPLTACETIETAVTKASADDAIIIASGTYTQNITINKNLTLQGNNSEDTILNGNAVGRVLTITQGTTVTIASLAITNGQAPLGAGIYNEGSLTLNNCRINNNSAIGSDGDNGESASGGGIYNDGILTLDQCLLHNNQVHGGSGIENGSIGTGNGGYGYGGSIYSINTLIAHNSIISDSLASGGGGTRPGVGRGGAIYSSGMVTIENSEVISNTAMAGGGLYSNPYAAGYSILELTSSTFKDNVALNGSGGAIANTGANMLPYSLQIDHSTLSRNRANNGGGVYTSGASAGATSFITITHSTIDHNLAAINGGALYISNQIDGIKTTTLSNSTISGNQATEKAGAIYLYTTSQSNNPIEVINSTIVSNTAATASGFHTLAGGSGLSSITFKNTIVSNNLTSPNCVNGYGGNTISTGNNIENGNNCNFTKPSDLQNTDPLIMPLADNGGETLTHALSLFSPAIDGGDNEACQAPPVSNLDQRDVERPLDGNGDLIPICDIGANESIRLPPIPTAGVTPSYTPGATATNTPIPSATPTNTSTPTLTPTPSPTSTPDFCQVQFEGTAVANTTVVRITGEMDSLVRILNLTRGGEVISDNYTIAGPFVGHTCPGFIMVSLNELLVVGDVIKVESSDSSFDNTVVVPYEPTATATFTPTPTATATTTTTATNDYFSFLPIIKNYDTSN